MPWGGHYMRPNPANSVITQRGVGIENRKKKKKEDLGNERKDGRLSLGYVELRFLGPFS
jgi:hypothetical protein